MKPVGVRDGTRWMRPTVIRRATVTALPATRLPTRTAEEVRPALRSRPKLSRKVLAKMLGRGLCLKLSAFVGCLTCESSAKLLWLRSLLLCVVCDYVDTI